MEISNKVKPHPLTPSHTLYGKSKEDQNYILFCMITVIWLLPDVF